MQSALAHVRHHVDTLYNAAAPSFGRKPRSSKTERHKAVVAIQIALTKKSTLTALTAASVLEMVTGPQEDPDATIPPLGWAELAVVLVETLQQACLEALASKATSKSGRASFKLEFITCFRDVLKLSLAHGPPGVIRPIVPAFLFFAHQWLSEPALRALIADQIWQCVRDLLQDDANRAMLTPPFIRTWVDVCVEQLTERGPLRTPSTVVSKLAGDVLETIARNVETYDTLTQSIKSVAPSKMRGGDYGYAIICERCCFMLVIAHSKSKSSPREARELQAVAFRTLTIALSDHPLDVVGSNALKSVINLSVRAIPACWKDRRHHDSAVALARILLLLAPTHRKLIEICRQRFIIDMRDESSSAVVRAGHGVKDEFIETAAACFSFRESLQFALSPGSGQGQVIAWLRVAVSILSRRVLKKGTSLLVDAADVLDQCSLAAETVTVIFRGHAKIRENFFGGIVRWSTQLVNYAAVIANRVHVEIKPANPFTLETWHNLYLVLREQLMKIKYSVRSRVPAYGNSGEGVHADKRLLRTVSLLVSLELFEKSSMHFVSQHTDNYRDIPYPLSSLLSSQGTPSALEIQCIRNLVARGGVLDKDGGHLRFRMIHALVDLCEPSEGSRVSPVKMLIDASSAALGLARGECTLRADADPERGLDGTHSAVSHSFMAHAFAAFQTHFGYSASEERISDEGGRLVEKVKDQERVWPGSSGVLARIEAAAALSPRPLSGVGGWHSGLRTPGHFSVDASLTEDIEQQILLKVKGLAAGPAVSVQRKPNPVRSTSPSEPSGTDRGTGSGNPTCGTSSRVFVFIGNYLLQGISLGIIPVGETGKGAETKTCEEMMVLLAELATTFAVADTSVLAAQFELSQEVIRISCQLCQALQKYLQPSSNSEARMGTAWFDLSRDLSSAMASVSRNLSKCLIRTTLQRTKENLKKVQHFANGKLMDPSSQHPLISKRKRGHSVVSHGRESKRRRRLQVRSDSEDSGIARRDYRNEDINRNSFGDEEDVSKHESSSSDSGSSDDDDFGNEEFGTPVKWKKSAPQTPGRHQTVSRSVNCTATLLRTCIEELPTVEDLVVDIFMNGMDSIDETERVLSPDGFERPALASSLVDESFISLRISLWGILFSLRTKRATEAAGADLLKVGVFWKGLEKVSHSYVAFYVESLKISNNSRKHYPMPLWLEQTRIAFLEHSRCFLEKSLVPDHSRIVEGGRPPADVLQNSPSYLVSRIVEIAEHFRLKHAFRMPRTTRISYFKFGLAVTELFGERCGELLNISERNMSQLNTLQDATQAIQAALCKFLCDSEAVVRILAAVSLPKLLASYSRHPTSQIEVVLQDSIPQSVACEESDTFFGDTNCPGDADTNEVLLGLQFELSAAEQVFCSTIAESFRKVGARAKACAAYVALGEVAAVREDLIPLCILQILFRALKGTNSLAAAYHVMVRLCVARGYNSPRRLCQTFARLLLPKWFRSPQAMDLLYRFPASLVVDVDHHRESVLFDWMRDQQALLIPHLLVADETPSLPRTNEFAEALGVDLPNLLSANVGPFSLVFPMQFVGSLNETGSALWNAIGFALQGELPKLMLQHKAEIIRSFLRGTSCGSGSGRTGVLRGFCAEKSLGFTRDTREIRPPFYDPLVIGLAINQLFDVESNRRIIQKSALRGSLFSEVRDEQNGDIIVESFNGLLEECQKSKVFLLRMLLTISRFLAGPPNPQPSHNRLDAYFCIGMLWRMLGVNILVKSSSERVIFYRLMGKGFEYHETVPDASWLLLEVQKKVVNMAESHPDVKVHTSDLSIDSSIRDYLLCMTSCRERQMFELLSAVSPTLVSVISKTSARPSDTLHSTALVALNTLLQLCHDEGLWTVILSNGPFPKLKYFSKARRLYESAKATVEDSTAEDQASAVISSLNRFQGIYRLRNDTQYSTTAFACVQELRALLTDSAVREVSRKMKSEGWVRSDGQDEPTVPHIRRSIDCLINLVYETENKFRNVSVVELRELHGTERKRLREGWVGMLHDTADVMGILGLLHPQSATYIRSGSYHMSIPALRENDRYEGIECGIRLSLVLLLKMLQDPSSIVAESALSTLIEILRTDDGKTLYSRDKDTHKLDAFTPFRNAARKRVVHLLHGLSSNSLVVYDPRTGDEVAISSFPALTDPRLWRIEEYANPQFEDCKMWMRRFCCVLAKNCGSDALKTLSSACFVSYPFACKLLPYLLMDAVKEFDEKGLSEISLLFREHILSNQSTPTHVLRAFVHALDVMCQVGLEVLYQKGVTHWLEKRDNVPALRSRYLLEIPYIEAARVALRSGSYFSAVRFSQMHIDQQVTDREFRLISKKMGQRTERRQSSVPVRDLSVERVEQAARDDVREVVRVAMTKINEPDGVRAFENDENLPKSAAGLAMLDRDWIRSVSALDIVASTNRKPGRSGIYPSTDEVAEQTFDMQGELSLFRSFIGLGTLSIATDYWTGLRSRISKVEPHETDFNDSDDHSATDELNDLRYAVAWKLGHWESPSLLPTRAALTKSRDESVGFHGAVFRVLRSIRTERFVEASQTLASARMRELRNLVADSSGASASNVFQSSARLQIFRILEDAIGDCSAIRINPADHRSQIIMSGDIGIATRTLRVQVNPGTATASIRNSEPLSQDDQMDPKPENIIERILEGSFCSQNAEDESFEVIPFRDAFSENILAEDLPIPLIRCLSKRTNIARTAAMVSMRLLRGGGSGAWSRAASCLGSVSSSCLQDASDVDSVTWKLQQARLRWSSSHDAPSRKRALASVKDIISKELGGNPTRRSSSTADDAMPPQALTWNEESVDSEKYAFLRAEACRLAAIWSLDMRTHEPMDLFETFLESGLQAVNGSNGAKYLASPAHFAMAKFADAQITNIDAYRKTRKYDQLVFSLREAEEKIEKLKTMKSERHAMSKTSSRRGSRSSRSELPSGAVTEHQIGRDLNLLIRNEEKKAALDRSRLEKLVETYKKWQILACKHFAACLRDGSAHDMRAAFRLVALWLDSGPMRDAISVELAGKKVNELAANPSIEVPVSKLLPLAPQLSSRLSAPGDVAYGAFQKVLSHTIQRMAEQFPAYCLWQLLALSNSTRVSANQERYSSLYRGDKDKKDAANDILNNLTTLHGETVQEMKKVADAYILLSETNDNQKNRVELDISRTKLMKLGERTKVSVPTVPLPLNAADYNGSLPHIVKFERKAIVCAGLSKPLRVVCYGSDGKSYPQMVKGRDDLRGDAVMEQLFTILNGLLEKDGEAAKRNLLVRTYRIIPLSPFSGIMQFVSNTTQFKDILVEKGKANGAHGSRKSLHERYRPKDMKNDEIFQKTFELRTREHQTKRIRLLAQVWQKFLPVFRFFFLEQWPDPAEWFSHQLAYSRSVAVMSIVGFILGLGDRHLSNILVDVATAEVVHIDFGIAFEQGKLLPTPERMPFRLTRDLVDGFGIAGVEGVFRRCSEITLSVMRRNKDVLLTVVEVLLHDPMFNWALTPEEVLREQRVREGGNLDIFDSDDMSRSLDESVGDAVVRKVKDASGSSEAHRALNRISEKLDGLEGTERLSVEAHVARLVDEARAFHVVAAVYPGWAPWL